ncbi:hypothetical protein AC1031_004486 [Aphanomyces cochlioides]|nr:hypothetical protein AC1031_004486 [Aphanomyces cochlioides]
MALFMFISDVSSVLNDSPVPRLKLIGSTPSTRGIVICLCDAMIPMTVSLVQELRALGYKDLIQMYHCDGELSNVSQRLLRDYDSNIEIVDGCREMVALGKLREDQMAGYRNFWLKPLALVHTRLDEVILMDADDLVFQNPSRLFDVPGYQETGTIFFYDREILKKEYLNNVYENQPNLHALVETFDYAHYGLKKNLSQHLLSSLAWAGDTAHEQDSSIVVVKKSKAPIAIDVLWHLLEHDRNRIGFSYGDKELFWLAYELAQRPYYFSPWANSGAATGDDMAKHPNTLCGGLAQFMPLETDQSEALHINGGYIFNPYKDNKIDSMTDPEERIKELLTGVPSFVSKRRKRSRSLNKAGDDKDPLGSWAQECLVHRGSEALRPQDVLSIQQRIKNAVRVAVVQQQMINETASS